MVRFVTFDAIFFVLPFAAYGLWLLVTQRSLGTVADWEIRTISYLTLAGAVLMIVSIVLLIQFDREPPGGTYVPAHMENGQIVPGRIVPPTETP